MEINGNEDSTMNHSTSTIVSSTTDEILQDGTTVRTLETNTAKIRFCFIDDTSTDSESDFLDNTDERAVNNNWNADLMDSDGSESSTTRDLTSPLVSPTSLGETSGSSFHTGEQDSANSESNSNNSKPRRQRSVVDEDQIDEVINSSIRNTPTSSKSGEDTTIPKSEDSSELVSYATKLSLTADGGARQKTPSVSSQTSQKSSNSSSSRPSSMNRENPFNKDLDMEEDHFLADSPSKTKPRPKLNIPDRYSSSEPDSSEGGEPLVISTEEDDFVFAHLCVEEDYFSQPEGHFGLSTREELEMAIDHCKELIVKAENNHDRKQKLVDKLVHLRLKLQETKEGPQESLSEVKTVLGHHFIRQEGRSARDYCEKCGNHIWGVLHVWYRCRVCDYCCHNKCLMSLTRTCAQTRLSDQAQYTLSICPERGLDQQQYRCSECRTCISFKNAEEPRQCDYNGNYYCSRCHWNDVTVIPARVIHNWDFTPHKVCRASKQYLRLMMNRPVLNIQDSNHMLFSFVEELSEIKRLRQEILMMKQYFLSCQDALNSKLLLQLSHRQHFVDGCDMYSLQDLVDLVNETLVPEICKIHTAFAQHIKTDCERCHAKGHICEICSVHEALFPFDNHVFVCQDCGAVMHKHCFRKKEGICPRCRRKREKSSKPTSS